MIFKQQKEDSHITIIMSFEHNSPAPEVGKIYKCFDDGKIRYSRLEYCRIDKAIDLDKDVIDKDLLDMLKDEINEIYWLYEPEQHIIYQGTMVNKDGSTYFYKDEAEPTICYFLRTKQKEWFGAGNWIGDGLLDTDDYYFNKYLKDEN